MRVLFVHNAYRHRGGEDVVVEREISLLRAADVDVISHVVASNSHGVLMAALAPWGGGLESELEQRLVHERPDILHAHNLFPLLSPRIFFKARRLNIGTVLTLHNFRPLCLNGLFLTPGLEICERCAITGHFGPGVVRGCYRGSRIQTAGLGLHIAVARGRGAYDAVDRFVAPSDFLRQRFVRYGVHADRIVVQPHAVQAISKEPLETPEDYVLYLGRLSEEKGVRWMIETLRRRPSAVRILLAGEGPLLSWVRRRSIQNVEVLGFVDGARKATLLKRALSVVLPSLCYENLPMTIAEANAFGVPAYVAGHGGLASTVKQGVNGQHFLPANADSFVDGLSALRSNWLSMERRAACQQYAHSQFSSGSFVARRLALYESIAELRRS